MRKIKWNEEFAIVSEKRTTRKGYGFTTMFEAKNELKRIAKKFPDEKFKIKIQKWN